MNPICPNCYKPGKAGEMNDTAVRLVSKEMSVSRSIDSIFRRARGILLSKSGDDTKGRSKYWYCKKCKGRWKKGSEALIRKD